MNRDVYKTEIRLDGNPSGGLRGTGQLYAGHPCFCVKKGVQSVQEWTPLELWFDEEGSAFTLTADEETKIVTEGEFGTEEYHIKCSKLDLIREIKNDIEKYFPDWVAFSEEYAYAEEEAEAQEIYQNRERLLRELLAELETALQKYTK